MRICAIFLVWDDFDLLKHSVKNIAPLVDGVIVVCSRTSNYGEVSELPPFNDYEAEFFIQEPDLRLPPDTNERNKRNFGLDKAKSRGYTHFIMCDSDEMYEAEPFLKEKERFLNPDLNGLVCSCHVYFKSPKLTIGLDTTLITFIHKITPSLKFEFNRRFPFAFDKNGIRIDPTRTLNINSGVEWSDIIMHHYSYYRKDLEKKIRNSTARSNLERSTIRQDFLSAKEGSFINFYGKSLIRASIDFNLPEFDVHKDLQHSTPDLI